MRNVPVPTRGPNPVYRAEKDPQVLLANLSAICALADREKEALAFLTPAAYIDAIEKRRLVGMLAIIEGTSEFVGFILYSGVYPNARIQQVVVARNHRRAHVASALLNEVVSQLEGRGYLTLTAAVASNLPAAQAFYGHNGLVTKRTYKGGRARNRQIVLRARELQTPNLFSILEPLSPASQCAVDLGLHKRSAGQAPLYVIDINVLFDVTKEPARPRAPLAERLIAAALAHQIRLAIAPEFIVELKRQTKRQVVDPILRFALQLPRLPTLDSDDTSRLAAYVHVLVFETTQSAGAGTPQALSDARHLAEAALARASAYVTSDGTMLAARDIILRDIGIDVTNLDEFVALLPVDANSFSAVRLKDSDVSVKPASIEAIREYLGSSELPQRLLSEFVTVDVDPSRWNGRAIIEGSEVVASCVYIVPNTIDAPARILVHVRPDHVPADMFVDHLLTIACHDAASGGPITIELPNIPSQTNVRRLATLRGFLSLPSTNTLIKVAVGRPVTATNWAFIARQLRRKTALRLPENPPNATAVQNGFCVDSPDGRTISVRLPDLEDALGPTLIAWPGRDGVIVPISRTYADDLLGTGSQIPLFGEAEAALVTRRTYFNTPRSAYLMRAGTPVLFYESKRSGGRGAVAASARIVDATVFLKQQVPDSLYRRAVVEDVAPLSASPEVLATTFDNLLRLPTPVTLEELREMRAVGSANLQTATRLPSASLSRILDMGWA